MATFQLWVASSHQTFKIGISNTKFNNLVGLMKTKPFPIKTSHYAVYMEMQTLVKLYFEVCTTTVWSSLNHFVSQIPHYLSLYIIQCISIWQNISYRSSNIDITNLVALSPCIYVVNYFHNSRTNILQKQWVPQIHALWKLVHICSSSYIL